MPKAEKNAYLRTPNAGKISYSVLFCISAKGNFCPPFAAYKAKYLYQTWTAGGPPGTRYGVTDSGWIEDFIFEDFIFDNFYLSKFLIRTSPVTSFHFCISIYLLIIIPYFYEI